MQMPSTSKDADKTVAPPLSAINHEQPSTARDTSRLVSFKVAATPGTLSMMGRIVRLGATLSVAEASVMNASGALLSSGRGAYLMPGRA